MTGWRAVGQRRAAAALATALTVVLGAACTGARGSGSAATTVRPGSGDGSGSGVTSSPADPYEQEFVNGDPCPIARAPGLPPGVGCVSNARGDLDGDGRQDRFVVYGRLDAQRLPTAWEASALLGSGAAVAPVAIPTGSAVEGQSDVYPRVVGAADADGDGRAEAFVKLTGIVYHIAVSHIAAIFDLTDGAIHQVEVRGEGPFHFFTGGTSRRGQGAVCASVDGRPVLLVRLIQVVPPERWSWTERTYVWEHGDLVPGAMRRGGYPQSVSIADPRITAFFALRCDGVFLE